MNHPLVLVKRQAWTGVIAFATASGGETGVDNASGPIATELLSG